MRDQRKGALPRAAARGLVVLLATTWFLDCGGSTGPSTPASPQPQPGSFTCAQIIGYSQTRNWYPFFEQGIDEGAWQLVARSGGVARRWADPGYAGWSNAPSSACAQNSLAPERIVMDVTRDEYQTDVAVFEQDIRNVIATIRGKYPSVRRIVLEPVVGGPNHTLCPPGATGTAAVRASFNHPTIDEAIARVLGGDVIRGADPVVRSCADYADKTGHLTTDGARAVGGMIAQFYAGQAKLGLVAD